MFLFFYNHIMGPKYSTLCQCISIGKLVEHKRRLMSSKQNFYIHNN